MTEATSRPHLTWGKIVLYCVALFLVWTLREFMLRQQVIAWLGPWGAAAVNTATKLLIWTVPAALLVRHYRADMAIPYLFRHPVHWGRVGLIALAFIGYNLIGGLIQNGRIAIHPSFAPVSLIGTVLFVGITEEMAFRGFLQNALMKRMKPMTALYISAFLFMLIHFPIWITKGVFDSLLELIRSCITVYALGMLFGYSFMKEENLLPPILLHMLWNLMVLLMIGG